MKWLRMLSSIFAQFAGSTAPPSIDPTVAPSLDPTVSPTASSLNPTTSPSGHPTFAPTAGAPTGDPSTEHPTKDPSAHPTLDPTHDPSMDPTDVPTLDPTFGPTALPTTDPTVNPTKHPNEATVTSAGIVISMDHISQILPIIIAFAAGFICLLLLCCAILIWIKCATHKKFNGDQAQELQDSKRQGAKHRTEITNALIANITVGEYDDTDTMPEGKSLSLEVNAVIEDLKQFSRDFGYKYMPITDKMYWSEQEILSFLRDDVGSEFFDENKRPKYDGLIVCISSCGNDDYVLTSDRQVMDKTAIHRLISNKYAAIREFPRIFIFDTCAVPEAVSMNGPAIDYDMALAANYKENNAQHVVAAVSEEMDTGDVQNIEFQERGSAPVIDVGKNTDFEDVRELNEWTHNTKNPDYNLVNINAVGLDEKSPNAIHYFTERVRENIDKQMELGLTYVEDSIKEDVRQQGDASFVSVLNNKTRTMMIRKRTKRRK